MAVPALTDYQKALLYELHFELKRKDEKGVFHYRCRDGCSWYPTVERLNKHIRSNHVGKDVYPKLEDGHRILDYKDAPSWRHLWENLHLHTAASAPLSPRPADKSCKEAWENSEVGYEPTA